MKKISTPKQKIEYYDKKLWIILITTILSIFFYFSGDSNLFFIFFLLTTLINLVVSVEFLVGMLYHMFKRADLIWLVAFVISLFFYSMLFVDIFYYFIVLRKSFKKGEGNYNERTKTSEVK